MRLQVVQPVELEGEWQKRGDRQWVLTIGDYSLDIQRSSDSYTRPFWYWSAFEQYKFCSVFIGNGKVMGDNLEIAKKMAECFLDEYVKTK
jgi:hypothetical protein